MNKATYLAQNDVIEFINWLVVNLPKLKISLRIKQSRFVPKGVSADITGFDNILSHYMWKSTGMTTGDWAETKARLTVLSNALRAAVNAGNHADTLDACDNILSWGGNRNRAVGAYKFLHSMAQGTLCPYIIDAGKAFSLNTASTAHLSPPVTRMNAMLTKVHALYSADGLPIYDSRVAAAIASLVELWRRATGQSGTLLPHALAFPATMTTRTVFRLFPDAIHPSVMPYGASSTPQQWSSAKVRLGWIMEEVLTRNPHLVLPGQAAHLVDRMHGFEASLFMIGYDIACLNSGTATATNAESFATVAPEYAKAIKKVRKVLTEKFTSTQRIDCQTLVKQCDFQYSGNLDDGFVIWYQKSEPVFLEPDFIEEMQNSFSGGMAVPFGFDMTGKNASANSFGVWIASQSSQLGKKLTGRNASHIAALLVQEGLAERTNNTIKFF